MSKIALITGITGQDGAYLAKSLLNKGYEVYGLTSGRNIGMLWRLEYMKIVNQVRLMIGNIIDLPSIMAAVTEAKPQEIYNLAAQSSVERSWRQPVLTYNVTGIGAINILEAIRLIDPSIRFFQASTSEMFGPAEEESLSEETPFAPVAPYGAAKLLAHSNAAFYREKFKMFCCSGIMFNHESPLRDREFVSRKLTDAVARIHFGLQTELRLGNIEAKRDRGFAGDFVEAMWLMLQQDIPDDYVIATGRTITVREMCDIAFKYVGLNYQDYVVADPCLYRPFDVPGVPGNPAKAKANLGWEASMGIKELIEMMVEEDLRRVYCEVTGVCDPLCPPL